MSVKEIIEKYFAIQLILITLYLLSGCTPVTELVESPEDVVNSLVANDDYARVLLLIDQVKPADPDYSGFQSQRASILKRMKTYEHGIQKQASILANKKQWGESLKLIESAMSKLPDSARLQQQYDKLVAEQQQFISVQSLSLAILRAESSAEELALLDVIYKANPSTEHANNKMFTQQHADQDQARLLRAAKTAVQKKQWSKAYTYIKLAEKNSPTAADTKLKTLITTQLKQEQTQLFFAAVANSDLVKAKAIAQEMGDYADTPEVTAALNKLQQEMVNDSQRLIAQGERYYTLGDFDKAIESWTKALSIDPENTAIKKRLLRVKLFQTNYKKLQADD